MARKDRVARQGKTGATGPRGPRGIRGTTGAKGQRGNIGKPGPKGLKGLKGSIRGRNVLEMVATHFEEVYRQLTELRKRIDTITDELEALLAPAGRRIER
jgi:collagen triple helix repeat protein